MNNKLFNIRNVWEEAQNGPILPINAKEVVSWLLKVGKRGPKMKLKPFSKLQQLWKNDINQGDGWIDKR
jgi:hypothetical protein